MDSNTELGKRFGKPDIERVGFFSEMGYMNGKGYVPILGKVTYPKGYNFVTSGRKSKNATQHGYFESEFKRLFIGEAVTRKPKKKSEAIPTPFILNSKPKKHSTPGDNFGTFTKSMEAFSAKLKPVPKFVHEPPNFVWRSGKIGGPGYADTGIDKYPEHLPDPYGRKGQFKEYGAMTGGPMITSIYPQAYFDQNGPYEDDPEPTVGLYLDRFNTKTVTPTNPWNPNGPAKSQGGSHAGCFDRFPEFMPCKYVGAREANKPRGSGKQTGVLTPIPMVLKTQYVTPIIDITVDKFMNTKNAKEYVPCYIRNLQVPLL